MTIFRTGVEIEACVPFGLRGPVAADLHRTRCSAPPESSPPSHPFAVAMTGEAAVLSLRKDERRCRSARSRDRGCPAWMPARCLSRGRDTSPRARVRLRAGSADAWPKGRPRRPAIRTNRGGATTICPEHHLSRTLTTSRHCQRIRRRRRASGGRGRGSRLSAHRGGSVGGRCPFVVKIAA